MNIYKYITLFIFSFFSFPLLSLSSPPTCPATSCYLSKITIRFPFGITLLNFKSCIYPGFKLTCRSGSKTVINLGNSGQFAVQSINYLTQEIYLNDLDNCLAARLLSLNLTLSPFKEVYTQRFTIFNCTSDFRHFKLNPIACLSGLNHNVFATSDEETIAILGSSCKLVRVISVPVQWSFDESVVSSDLSEDLRLSWGTPSCRRCELRGEECVFKSSSSLQVGCIGDTKHGLPNRARYAISAATVVIVMFVVGLLCFLCGRIRSAYNRNGPSPVTNAEVALQPVAVLGLDEPTIESYPKVVVGQSPTKLNSDTCAICLSEYVLKDILRSIPQCQHCFHVDCIDEWLRLNPSCPVCRYLPDQKFPDENLIL